MNHSFFGTDGIRGRIGTHPLTVDSLLTLGKALGHWIEKTYGSSTILIGYDTRQSCSLIKSALATGLLTQPLLLVDGYILPTPAIAQLVQKTDLFSCGIIISASHNPYHDNGIKLITKQGKISAADEQEITDLFYQQNSSYSYDTLGTMYSCNNAAQQYATYVRSFFKPLFLDGITVVLDCAHGATSALAPTIFNECGARTLVINNKPSGTNINDRCGSVLPEQLQQAVLENHADIGFAFDGDGDRVIAVNRQGIIKTGDDFLALLCQHPLYAKESGVVGTVLSNYGLQRLLENSHKQLIRTDVGDKYVGRALKTHNLLLGGEQSGHLIMRDYLDSGDGIFAALRILEAIISTNNWDFESFTPYPQIQINVPIKEKKDLSQPPLATIIASYQQQIEGRLIVRYSGTEQVLRIMVEDNNLARAQNIATNLSNTLQQQLL